MADPHDALPRVRADHAWDGNISDAQVTRAALLMREFGRAVGSDAALRRVCAEIFAESGIARPEDLVARGDDPEIGWRWLARVAVAAAERGDRTLPSAIFAMTDFWVRNFAGNLTTADLRDLVLPVPGKLMHAGIAVTALPCLRALPPSQVIMGNQTGDLTVKALTILAASTIVSFAEDSDIGDRPDGMSTSVISSAYEALGRRPASDGFDRVLLPAQNQLSHIKESLTELGLAYTDLDPVRHNFGVGVCLAWTDVGYAVLSVAAAIPYMLNLTAGLLKNVEHDRLRILNVCNDLTKDNTFRPVYLHDDPIGWDIHVQQRLPINVIIGDAPLLRSLVEGLPREATELRSKFLDAGVKGETYELNVENVERLLLRSVV